MINRIPMSLFLNSKGKSIKGIAHNQYTSRSKMKGRIVSFIGIFLMISLEMMEEAEGNPAPAPKPAPGPQPAPAPGPWLRGFRPQFCRWHCDRYWKCERVCHRG